MATSVAEEGKGGIGAQMNGIGARGRRKRNLSTVLARLARLAKLILPLCLCRVIQSLRVMLTE